jgi:TonB-linked SusC/RagA family outer membrane protein
MKKLLLLAWSILLITLPFNVFSQTRTITGTVTDERGDPLPLVSVLQKGTNAGTTTDERGNFSLPVTGTNVVLVFSYSGLQSQELVVGTSNTYNVSLRATGQLSEVVVTALGIRRSERSLGYSTQEVKGDNLTLTKEQNVLGSLAGKIAGVQVTGSSGANMGGTQKINIRGINSVSGGSQPLIVVDGTPISNANFSANADADYGNLAQDINPEDIESVNVLKGPAASALYGLRGQYGVIMITTKKGSRGAKKVNVQVNSAFSVERAGNFMPMQNLYGGGASQTWRTLPNGEKYVDMSVDESWGPRMDGTLVRDVFSFYPQDPDYGKLTPFVPNPNNLKDYYETGSNINNGVTVTGGNENSTFRLSFNDTRIQGVEPNSWLNRNNLGLSAGLDLTSKLNVHANFNFATNSAQRPGQGSEHGSRYTVQWFARNVDMNRLRDYKYADGTIKQWNLRRPSTTTGEITNFSSLYWDNPYFEAYENLNGDNRDRFFGDVGLTYELIKGLKLSGFVRSDLFTQNLEERQAFGGRRVASFYTGKFQNREMNYEFLGQYNKGWGDFSLNANVGANLYKRKYNYLSMSTAGGLSAPGFYNIDASIDRPNTTSYLLRKEIRSLYGMASVGYKNTFFVDASIRNDNSSTLPVDNNSYWYPSLSGSFVFSELLKWNPLSFGKLRVSYAQAGSDLNPYQTSEVYGIGTVYGTTNSLFVPDNLNNPNIEPSFAHSYEAGMDIKFFQNRIGLDITYYEQKNKNQIINLNVSGTSGYGSAVINAGLISNRGIEFSLTGSPVRTKNFSWDATFNLSRNRSKVEEIGPDMNVYPHYSTTYSSVTTYLNSYVGEAFGSLIGPTYQRDSATGKILLGNNNLPLFTASTHNFGSVLPDYTGGLLNSFNIFGFNLSAMIDFQKGGLFFSRSHMLAVRTGQHEITAALNDKGKNVRDPIADGGGIRVDGINSTTKQEVTAYVNPQTYYGVVGRRIYDDWLHEASYIKLREVRLGYSFDRKVLGNLPFSSVNLALIARNPAMLWQKAPKGIDPSENTTGAQSISWFESGQLNTVRSYGINLNFNF